VRGRRLAHTAWTNDTIFHATYEAFDLVVQQQGRDIKVMLAL